MMRLDIPQPPALSTDAEGREKAMLAHDIRGALNGVVGGIAAIDLDAVDPGLRTQLERVCAASEHLALLVTDTFGEQDGREGVDLEVFRRRIARRWEGEATARGLRFMVEVGPRLPRKLQVQAAAFTRVVSNLLSNAIKFTPSGAVLLLIRRTGDGGCEVAVLDEGPGLRGHAADQLCAFGFREGANSGDGIGLHIVKALVDRMEGELVLRNRPGGGLEALFRLPAEVCCGEAPVSDVSGVPDLAGVRILLAEDNPTNQLVATQMLGSMNADVVVAGDGVEAMAAFEAAPVDLVLVDIEMPRMSGLDVIREIRARRDRRARTPIIALTAYALREHKLKIAEAGADGLISKPVISTASLGQAILQHLPAPGAAAEAANGEVADAPLIDMDVYQSLADTIGTEMMTELLDRIILDLHDARIALAAASDPLDCSGLRSTSHILISVAGAFGAARLRRRAADLNAAANAGDADCASAVRACLEELAPAIAFAQTKRSQC